MQSSFRSYEELSSEVLKYQKSNGIELYLSKCSPLELGNSTANVALKYSAVEFRCEYGKQLCVNYTSPSGTACRQCPFTLSAKSSDDLQTLVLDFVGESHSHSLYKPNYLEDATKIYRELAQIPSLGDASILESPETCDNPMGVVRVSLSQRSLEQLKRKQLSQDFHLLWDKDCMSIKRCSTASMPVERSDVVSTKISPSRRQMASIKKTSKSEKDTYFLEIFSDNSIVKSINLSKMEKHGDIYSPGALSDMQWSECETKLAYIAEKKTGPALSYFGSDDESKKIGVKGSKFAYREDWGEVLVGQKHSIVSLFDLTNDTVKVFDCLPEDVAVSKVCWSKDGSTLFFVGVFLEPYRLGLVACDNRRCALFKLDVGSNTCEKLMQGHDTRMIISPRLSPDGTKLIFFSRDAGGPHLACNSLVTYTLATLSTHCVYPYAPDGPDVRIGLYTMSLIQNCWVDNKHVIVDTPIQASRDVCVVNIETQILSKISDEDGAWTLLDAQRGFVLCGFQQPNNAGCLKIGKLDGSMHVKWNSIALFNQLSLMRIRDNVSWKIINISLGGDEMQSVLHMPKSGRWQKPPLIVWSHGGPHGTFVANYMMYATAFCMLGYAVLLVNYRGSLGFGQNSLTSLLGNVGTQDVEDVQATVQHVVAMEPVDPDNLFLFGGSHGGFLSCHLVGQYPTYYRACALRNPVIDIATMVHTSDIPDWCCVEAGIPFEASLLPSAENFKTMHDASPIAHASKIQSPVLLLVGENDLRVPPPQSIQLYRFLRSTGKNVMMRSYPDNSHSLSGVEAEADVFMETVKWFGLHHTA